MFDAKTIGKVIGKEAFEAIHASNLPKHETMTLLQIWTHSSRAKLSSLALSGDLLKVINGQHRAALEEACELRINNPHLTQAECLQAVALPLIL